MSKYRIVRSSDSDSVGYFIEEFQPAEKYTARFLFWKWEVVKLDRWQKVGPGVWHHSEVGNGWKEHTPFPTAEEAENWLKIKEGGSLPRIVKELEFKQ